MRIRLAPRRLFARVALVVVGIALVQFVVTILLYDRISRDSVREDHARRVAELLEVSERLAARGEPGLGAVMSTKHLQVWVTPEAAVAAPGDGDVVRQITALVRQWEPELVSAPLHMAVQASSGRDHLIGSMRLEGGDWLNFRSANLSSPWPIVASASLISLITSAMCVMFAALALRQLGAPLRRLAAATEHIGEGTQITLVEEGSSDLRHLSHAFNVMQARIARILSDQARSLVAISHDLRTPLSRLRLTTDFIEPADMRGLVDESVGEMEGMIASLQSFLAVQEVVDQPAEADLLAVAASAAERWPDRVRLAEPIAAGRVLTYAEVLRQALVPLIENAVQYGGEAAIRIEEIAGTPCLVIGDKGPGIDAEHFPSLVEPFFRVDEARARNTPGFGLGIPRAHRLLQRFGGGLSFRPGPAGGLEVVVRPPRPAGGAMLAA